MIFIDNSRINFGDIIERRTQGFLTTLRTKTPNDRSDFIDSKRADSWRADDVLAKLLEPVGHKCWYSEIALVGANFDVDHFRPKGKIREIDYANGFNATGGFNTTGVTTEGYWWCAFDVYNFRLSSQHANQRRVDTDTNGGKWDFFPVDGLRGSVNTPARDIHERNLPLDPCSLTDIKLLAFDPTGKPIWSGLIATSEQFDRLRVELSIWLYHLNKLEVRIKRERVVQEFNILIDDANLAYKIWQGNSTEASLRAMFDRQLSRIRSDILPHSEFSRAKLCKLKYRELDYSWIAEYLR